MSGKLDGRVAVITGAAQGIGFAIAERFKAEGAKLLMADLDETKVNAAADRLASKSYVRPLVHAGNLADETVAQDMIRTAITGYGTLDILINNAGGGIIQPFVEESRGLQRRPGWRARHDNGIGARVCDRRYYVQRGCDLHCQYRERTESYGQCTAGLEEVHRRRSDGPPG